MTTLTPTRRGRCAGLGDWQAQYQALRMTGEEAAALIRDGDDLVFTPLTNWPREVDAALAARPALKGLSALDGGPAGGYTGESLKTREES